MIRLGGVLGLFCALVCVVPLQVLGNTEKSSEAKGEILLEKRFAGDVSIRTQDGDEEVVTAHKKGGAVFRIRLVPGEYRIEVRNESVEYQCKAGLSPDESLTIEQSDCSSLKYDQSRHRRNETLFFELGIGFMIHKLDPYIDTLFQLGYQSYGSGQSFHLDFSAMYSLRRFLQFGIGFSTLESEELDTWYGPTTYSASWTGVGFSGLVRGTLQLADDWVSLYLQAGAGVAVVNLETDVYTAPDHLREDAVESSVLIRGGGGMALNPWKNLGFYLQGEYFYAPALENEYGQVKNCGGASMTTGIRSGF